MSIIKMRLESTLSHLTILSLVLQPASEVQQQGTASQLAVKTTIMLVN
jgi:hypothetical protein